jgi:hypothetical protein
MAIFGLTRVPNNPEIEPAPNIDRAQLAALGEAAIPDALTVSVRRPPPAAGHFAD